MSRTRNRGVTPPLCEIAGRAGGGWRKVSAPAALATTATVSARPSVAAAVVQAGRERAGRPELPTNSSSRMCPPTARSPSQALLRQVGTAGCELSGSRRHPAAGAGPGDGYSRQELDGDAEAEPRPSTAARALVRYARGAA